MTHVVPCSWLIWKFHGFGKLSCTVQRHGLGGSRTIFALTDTHTRTDLEKKVHDLYCVAGVQVTGRLVLSGESAPWLQNFK
jgi:hypothetical protein